MKESEKSSHRLKEKGERVITEINRQEKITREHDYTEYLGKEVFQKVTARAKVTEKLL